MTKKMTNFFLGSDISKGKINFCLYYNGLVHSESECKNDQKNIESEIKVFLDYCKFYAERENTQVELFVSCEYTGIYNNILLRCLLSSNIKTYVIHAPNIKNSLGISREKNDIVDARLIAEYTCRFQDKLQVYSPDNKSIEELKALESERARYVKTRSQLTQGKSDQKKFLDSSISEILQSCCEPVVESLNEAIGKIEKRMKEIITKDSQLKESFDILTSVPGIGPVTARSTICATNNFTKIKEVKKFGCYSGIVPFGKSSGQVKGKQKVSKMANMEMKRLLSCGATAIKNRDNKLGRYYQRKLAEGKHPMIALNNLKNKMITVAFGCILKGEKYQEDYEYRRA